VYLVAQDECLVHNLDCILLAIALISCQHDCAEAAITKPRQDVKVRYTDPQPAGTRQVSGA
jgi:hypothetical protein